MLRTLVFRASRAVRCFRCNHDDFSFRRFADTSNETTFDTSTHVHCTRASDLTVRAVLGSLNPSLRSSTTATISRGTIPSHLLRAQRPLHSKSSLIAQLPTLLSTEQVHTGPNTSFGRCRTVDQVVASIRQPGDDSRLGCAR